MFAAVSSRYKDRSSDFFGVVFFFSALVSGSVWLALGAPPAPTQSLWIAGVAAVLFATGYALYDFGTKKGNAQLIGVISFLTPVLAAFYLVLLGQAELTASLALSLVLVVAGIGALMMLGLPLGRLPGDIVISRGRGTFYFPIVTCIVVSVVLTLLMSLFRR